MKKIETTRPVFQFNLLFIALVVTAFLYGGLTINKLYKENAAFQNKQIALEEKLNKLESNLVDSQNNIAALQDKVDSTTATLTKTQKDLVYYRQLALDAKEVLGASTAQTNTITPATIIKTSTKKVYVTKEQVSVGIQNVGSYKVDVKADDTAFSVLKRAAAANNFSIDYQTFDFGVFITAIDSIKPADNQYWSFYYNGKYSQAGASDQKVATGDTTFWELASF